MSRAQDELVAALEMFHGQNKNEIKSYRPGTDRKKWFPLGSESIMPVLKCITG